MSSTAVTINGLAELRQALRALPDALVHEADVLVQAAAADQARAVLAAYPTGPTGNLRAGVRVEVASVAGAATARVKSGAFHAWLYERGSARRFLPNGKYVGRMPRADLFIPIAIERRARLHAALLELVRRAGLTVTA